MIFSIRKNNNSVFPPVQVNVSENIIIFIYNDINYDHDHESKECNFSTV